MSDIKKNQENYQYCLKETNKTLIWGAPHTSRLTGAEPCLIKKIKNNETHDYDYFKKLHPKYNDDVINVLVKASKDKFIERPDMIKIIKIDLVP
jgi:hypothetical protein